MFDLLFEDTFHESQYMRNFVFFTPLMMRHKEVYDAVMRQYERIGEEAGDAALVSWRYIRLERLVSSWLETMSGMIVEAEPLLMKELCSSPLLGSEHLREVFKEKIKKLLVVNDGDEKGDTVKDGQQQSAERVLTSLANNDLGDAQQLAILLETFSVDPTYTIDEKSTRANLIQLQPGYLAEQLVAFDSEEYKKILPHDFYLTRENSTLDRYRRSCEKVEYWLLKTMDLIGKTEIFEYFIKVAQLCLSHNGYNTAYFIYSTLSRNALKHQDAWSVCLCSSTLLTSRK